MTEDLGLLEAFPPVSREEWMKQVIKDLKGADYNDKLVYTTVEGIRVDPFYTAPETAPETARQPLFSHTSWDIMERLQVTGEKAANRLILQALQQGATGLVLEVKAAVDLSLLLEDVELPYIRVIFQVQGDPGMFASRMEEWMEERGYDPGGLHVAVDADYIHRALVKGEWAVSEQEDAARWLLLHRQLAPLRTLYINGSLYQEAGAPPAYQIGCILAHLQEYVSLLTTGDAPAENIASRIQIEMAVGQDYFFEIAKWRAIRKVYALFAEEYGFRAPLEIHAVTASRNLTLFDAHNNLLRTSTAAMAAVCGGCNSLAVTPYDQPFRDAEPFSLRMARNIQLILQAESYFDKVADVSAGSYFVETLTQQIAEKAWEYFTAIERGGGMIEAVKKGTIQAAIQQFHEAEQQALDEGKLLLVGTNKYPDKTEQPPAEVTHTPRQAGTAIVPLYPVRLAERLELERINQAS